MGNNFASGDWLPLCAGAKSGKIRKDLMSKSRTENGEQPREIEQAWAALWLSAEMKTVRERDARVDAAERA
jgi:hypothetical protein